MGGVLIVKHLPIAAAALLTAALPAAAADVAATNARLIGWAEALAGPALAARLAAAETSETLTPLAMFMDADWVVKAVMLGLAAASVLGWAVWAGKLAQVAVASQGVARSYRQLVRAGHLDGARTLRGPFGRMVAAARAEALVSEGLNPEGVKARVSSELQRIEAGATRGMQSGVMILGSIGSTAPFIGLFGTVWGIMNSFVGIAESGTTNLSVVAPGIAEALLATAIGLVAAIPAVLLYNHLTRVIGGYRARLADAVALVERTLSRDLDRAAVRPDPCVTPLHLVAE